MTRLALALAFSLTACVTPIYSQTITGIDWQLLAIDGGFTDARATLRIDEDGAVSGAAPCNRWSSANAATLPAIDLRGIRATRMACDRLADEQIFFDALAMMTTVKLDGSRNLVLTGPDGRSVEFVLDVMNSLTRCKTCPPTE